METLWATVEHGMERAFVEACFGIIIDDENNKVKCDSPEVEVIKSAEQVFFS